MPRIMMTYNQRNDVHPDTQVQELITNDCRHVKTLKKGKVTLTGIDTNSRVLAQTSSMGPDVSVIVLAHEDLRKTGLKVHYDSRRIVAPGPIIQNAKFSLDNPSLL